MEPTFVSASIAAAAAAKVEAENKQEFHTLVCLIPVDAVVLFRLTCSLDFIVVEVSR